MRDERLLGHSEIYHEYNFSGPDRVHLISLTFIPVDTEILFLKRSSVSSLETS